MKRINISEAPAETAEPTQLVLDADNTEWQWFTHEGVILRVDGSDVDAWEATEDEWDALAESLETERAEAEREREAYDVEAADDEAYERSLFHQ